MSILISGSPQTFTPAFNPIYYYIDSTNKTEEGFKYIVDVWPTNAWSGATNANKRIARYKLFPRPGDGLGVADINQIISSQVNYSFDWNATGFTRCDENWFKYDVLFGEEYVDTWEFFDNGYVFSPPSLSGNVLFTGYTEHYFNVGDYVTINQYSGYTNESYQGIHQIVGVPDSYSFIIDLPFGESTPAEGGTATSYDSKVFVNVGDVKSTGNTAFNGVISHKVFDGFNTGQYVLNNVLGSSLTPFISSVSRTDFRIAKSNKMWLNIYHPTNTYTNARNLKINVNYGGFSQEYFIPNLLSADTNTTMLKVALGPANITDVFPDAFPCKEWQFFKSEIQNDPLLEFFGKTVLYGTTPPPFSVTNDVNVEQFSYAYKPFAGMFEILEISGNTMIIDFNYGTIITPNPMVGGIVSLKPKSYTVQVINGSGDNTTMPYTFELIEDKPSRYERVTLYFLDRLGSFIPFNFDLNKVETINVNRTAYKQFLGNLKSNGRWGYNSEDRGMTSLNINYVENLTINTDWLTETESILFKELLTSPVVFIEENGKPWPVLINTNSLTVLRKNNAKNIQYSLDITYSNQDQIQHF
jgi:hypothetical protein